MGFYRAMWAGRCTKSLVGPNAPILLSESQLIKNERAMVIKSEELSVIVFRKSGLVVPLTCSNGIYYVTMRTTQQAAPSEASAAAPTHEMTVPACLPATMVSRDGEPRYEQ